MAELVTVKLEEILVDPRLSPRRVVVDEEYLERLGEVLAEGGELPPLQVARVADRTAPWCGCGAPHNRRRRVEQEAEARRIPFASLPPLPNWVLVDGISRYWALQRAGQTAVAVEVLPEPARSGQDVTIWAYQANSRHGRLLDDWDRRRAFVRLWLGRDMRESNESWLPAEGGVGPSEAAAMLGHGGGWASKMKAWAQVEQAVKLPLVMSCAYALSRAPEGAWWEFCWHGTGAERVERLQPLLDEELRPIPYEPPRPVRELPRLQIERHVERLLAAEQPPAPLTEAPAPKPAQLAFNFGPDWQPTFTGPPPRDGLDTARSTVRSLMDLAPTMAHETLRDALLEVTMVEAEASDARVYLRRVAKAHQWEV